MKEKIKKVLKNRIFIFVMSAILFSVVGVSAATYFESGAVTYDNTESGLTSTNVQGAIDELYSNCQNSESGGKELLNNVPIVTSGDGLYIDDIECRYFYKGTNPNNYITFNGETAGWRIMSVECDGAIKIMRINSIGNMAFDTEYSSYAGFHYSTLSTYLNGEYYNGLNSNDRSKIVSHLWGTGSATRTNVSIADMVWLEKNNVIGGMENSRNYIALPSIYEFQRTSSGQAYGTNNWMKYNTSWWTISAYFSDVWFIEASGEIYRTSTRREYAIRPTLYLSSDVKLSGSGTKSDPFVIE